MSQSSNNSASLRERIRNRRHRPTLQMIGISHHNCPLHVREQFHFDENGIEKLTKGFISEDKDSGLLVLSTCNRTELYSFTPDLNVLFETLSKYSSHDIVDFCAFGYHKTGKKAVQHLFRVAAGLDSQILGDFQISGQLRQAFQISKANGGMNAQLETLFSKVIHSSRIIKQETQLNQGTSSLSYAALQHLKRHIPSIEKKPILLVGLGDIGKALCLHLKKLSPNSEVYVVNRTLAKAELIAKKFNWQAHSLEDIPQLLEKVEIGIVSTASKEPLITPTLLLGNHPMVWIDLSVPGNIDRGVEKIPGQQVIRVDTLHQTLEETKRTRKEDVPAAEEILTQVMNQYLGKLGGMRV